MGVQSSCKINQAHPTTHHTTKGATTMASKEFILKRIQGKQREIARLNAKLDRINAAETSNWENNPYGYSEYDRRITLKDLSRAQEALAEYQAQLTTANEMEASRNVPAITEFLTAWKAHVTEFYNNLFSKYPEALKQYHEDMKPYTMEYFQENKFRKEQPDAWREWNTAKKLIKEAFEVRFACIAPYIDRVYNPTTQRYDQFALNTDKMNKDLQTEYDRKYDFIIARTNEIVGQITDASNLSVGPKGDLNGYIIGTKGCCSVKTIGAGGYNIQCYHFRTLIHSYTPDLTPAAPAPAPKAEPKPEITSFKGMSIDELKALCEKVGASCKTYNDPKIYKMRLIMAIKKAI